MKVFETNQSREEYVQTQIERSQAKFNFCKVYLRDTIKYRRILGPISDPIVCMGTRNGKEIDLFRLAFRGGRFSRSKSDVSGVEINPWAKREDVWVGSFDQMPDSWDKRFGLIFSNSFDQALDPEKTAKEWLRVLKPGGYLILCYSEHTEPTLSDPVGRLTLKDMMNMFGDNVIYHRFRGSAHRYTESIIKV